MSDTLAADVVDADLRAAVLLQFWPRMAHWLDTIVEALIVTFTAEREQCHRGVDGFRRSHAEAVAALNGGPPQRSGFGALRRRRIGLSGSRNRG
jgi:hypothetical protein